MRQITKSIIALASILYAALGYSASLSQDENSYVVNLDLAFDGKCGVIVNWGDGSEDKIRVGYDVDTRFTLSHDFKKAGDFVVQLKGKGIFRGLKSVSACKISNERLAIQVSDPKEAEANKYAEESIEELENKNRKKSEKNIVEYRETDHSLYQPEADPFDKMESMRQSVAQEKNEYALQELSVRLLTCDDTMLGVSEVAESNGEIFLRAGVGFFDEFDRFAAVTPAKVLKGAADQGLQMNDIFVPFISANTVVNDVPLRTVVQKKDNAAVFFARSETTISTGADYGKPLITEVFYDFDNSRIVYTKRELKGDSSCKLASKKVWISR